MSIEHSFIPILTLTEKSFHILDFNIPNLRCGFVNLKRVDYFSFILSRRSRRPLTNSGSLPPPISAVISNMPPASIRRSIKKELAAGVKRMALIAINNAVLVKYLPLELLLQMLFLTSLICTDFILLEIFSLTSLFSIIGL